MFFNGYKYWLIYTKEGKKYYRCAKHKGLKKCPGKALLMENGKIQITTPHNHNEDEEKVLVDTFRKVLVKRAMAEETDLHKIYLEEATIYSEAALLYSFSSAESAMRKARKKRLPNSNRNLNEMGEILQKSELYKINCRKQMDPFYQTTIKLECSTAVIFVHTRILEIIGKVEEVHINSTVDFGRDCRILTIHSITKTSHSVPIFYAIYNYPTQQMFAAIFTYLREQFDISPSVIICDFNSIMQSALELVYPEANIKGNWFEYVDSISKQLGILKLHGEVMRGHGVSALRMILVLPLLPADYMAPGFEALKKWMGDKSVLSPGLNSLCSYVEQYWIKGFGPGRLSMFRTTTNIDNHTGAFNRELENMIGTEIKKPSIWQVVEALVNMATKMFLRQNRQRKSVQPKKNQYITIQQNATEQWIRTPLHLRNPLQFLQLTSHFINESFYSKILKSNDSKKLDNHIKPGPSPKISAQIQNIKAANTISSSKPNYSSDPPPLAFFPRSQIKRAAILNMSEPPPLVPIKKR